MNEGWIINDRGLIEVQWKSHSITNNSLSIKLKHMINIRKKIRNARKDAKVESYRFSVIARVLGDRLMGPMPNPQPGGTKGCPFSGLPLWPVPSRPLRHWSKASTAWHGGMSRVPLINHHILQEGPSRLLRHWGPSKQESDRLGTTTNSTVSK